MAARIRPNYGIVIVEQTAVEPAGRIGHGCLGLYSDANEEALARVVGFCRRAGSAALGVQLAHAGRKGSAKLAWEGWRHADFVALVHGFLDDPRWGWHAAYAVHPPQCRRAHPEHWAGAALARAQPRGA